MNPDAVPRYPDNWFAEAFNSLYPLVYAHRTDEAAAEEVRFALEVTTCDLSLPLLDCGCGTGRHMRRLIRSAPTVVGLDFSLPLLRIAQEKLGADAHLVRGDMRCLPFTDDSFGYIFSFFTSFGYFTDEENDRAVSEWARVLKPGGTLFLDYLNSNRVRRNLRPESRRVIDQWSIEEFRWIDEKLKRVNKRVRITNAMGTWQDFRESVRLYEPEELIALLAGSGMYTSKCYGAYDGRPWSPDTERLILVARRKAN